MAAAVFEYIGIYFGDLVPKTLEAEEEPAVKIQAACDSLAF